MLIFTLKGSENAYRQLACLGAVTVLRGSFTPSTSDRPIIWHRQPYLLGPSLSSLMARLSPLPPVPP
ncbi:hypothetical protein BD779DRAFT_1524038 [Infundibulicybe gibba]|nr:hypothetical protein BD779DRAFT_1524038 [Infundibulicybe gibba]